MHKPPGRPSPSLLDFLVRRRFRSSTDLTKSLLAGVRQQQRPGASASVWKQHRDDQRGFRVFKGVHKGNFVRVKVPRAAAPSLHPWQHLGLLPSVMTFPPVLPTNVREKAAAMMAAATHPSDWRYYALRFQAWLYENYGTIAMNIGSICTLIGFTCTDVSRNYMNCDSTGPIVQSVLLCELFLSMLSTSTSSLVFLQLNVVLFIRFWNYGPFPCAVPWEPFCTIWHRPPCAYHPLRGVLHLPVSMHSKYTKFDKNVRRPCI